MIIIASDDIDFLCDAGGPANFQTSLPGYPQRPEQRTLENAN